MYLRSVLLAFLSAFFVSLSLSLSAARAEPPPRKAKEGETCGTIRGIPCEEGLFCDPRPGMCRGADVDGTCVRVPEVCTQEYAPVCGCDGKTYGNDCERRAARAPKDHEGECRSKPQARAGCAPPCPGRMIPLVREEVAWLPSP